MLSGRYQMEGGMAICYRPIENYLIFHRPIVSGVEIARIVRTKRNAAQILH